MARLTLAQKKTKAATERKRKSRALIAEGGSYRVHMELDVRAHAALTAVASKLGCTAGQVLDDLAATYRLGTSPRWTTPDYYVDRVSVEVRVEAKTLVVLKEKEPYLLPADAAEWLVLAACRVDLDTGALTYHHPTVIGFGEDAPCDSIPFDMPAGSPPDEDMGTPTAYRWPGGPLRAWNGQSGRWDGPVRDRYVERMAYRQATREAVVSGTFRKVEAEDYSTMQAEVRIDNPYESGSWMQDSATPLVTQAKLSGVKPTDSIPRREPHGYYDADNWVESEIIEKLKKHKPIELDRNVPEPTRAPGKSWKQKWEEAQDWADPKPAKDTDDDDDRHAMGV